MAHTLRNSMCYKWDVREVNYVCSWAMHVWLLLKLPSFRKSIGMCTQCGPQEPLNQESNTVQCLLCSGSRTCTVLWFFVFLGHIHPQHRQRLFMFESRLLWYRLQTRQNHIGTSTELQLGKSHAWTKMKVTALERRRYKTSLKNKSHIPQGSEMVH